MSSTWQQPKPASGWAPTLRRWGRALAPIAPFALGLLIPSPLAVVTAGTMLVGGTAGVIASRVSNPWRDYRPEPGQVWDPKADELPEPGLLEVLGLAGLRVAGVLRGGEASDPWLAFQIVDRLGGHSTRVVVQLPGRATTPLSMVALSTRRSAGMNALSYSAFGRYRPARGSGKPAEQHFRLSSSRTRAVLSEAQVARWSVHEQYLVGELYDLGRSAFEVNLRRSVAWLQRLRDAFPATLLQPAERTTPTDDADWPLLDQGEPIVEQQRPFIPKPSRQKFRRARPPQSP